MSDEVVLYVTEDGHVKAKRIMTTVRENLASTDKGMTNQPLIKQFISIHGGVDEQALEHKPHMRQNQSRGKQ
jgi:hypothetical protein